MIDRIQRLDSVTRLQYGLMIVFGAVSLVAALAPIPDNVKIAAVSVTFGFTAGLWVSHLMTVVFPPKATVAVDE